METNTFKTKSYLMQLLISNVEGTRITSMSELDNGQVSVVYEWDTDDIEADNGVEWYLHCKANGYLDNKKFDSKEFQCMKLIHKDKVDRYVKSKWEKKNKR